MKCSTPAGVAPASSPDTGGLIRWPAVRDLTGLSRSTVDRLERAGSFPRRFVLSRNIVGWSRSAVLAWAQSREVRQ
ncbi:MAG: AlpA family phage regulatory protein [Candidatus Competibacter sp.]|nr:AlpA family phage regulatory protein [Candidatus Competibacter sp.]